MSHVTVVIIGRNEGTRLLPCIQSVQAMEHPDFDFDIVYVDSNSTDESVAVAQAAGIRTILLNTSNLTAALARNTGWRASQGEFVLFLDGDTIVHPTFVRSALPAFADSLVAVVCGERIERFPHQSLYNRVFDLDWNGPPGPADYCGGDALFRRQVLEESGGYDDTLLAGEEPELCTRLRLKGWTVLHLALSMTTHDLAMTRFSQYWRRSMRTGYAYAEVSARFRDSALPLWSKEARRNRNHVLGSMILVSAALILAGVLNSWLPVGVFLAAAIFLILRSAWKARRKSSSMLTLLLYGLHSHLQQLPIYLGQRKFGVRKGS